jgi:hypothetical protein
MLSDQWFRIGSGASKREQIGQIAYVTQSDANIAQKAAAFDSFDRRISEKMAKLGVVQL